MYEEGKADSARHLELDSAKEIKCNILLQSARYLQGAIVTMTGTFNDTLSMLEV
jgi:hypothetical protein